MWYVNIFLKEWCMQFLTFCSLLALLSHSPLNLCKNCSHKLNVAHMSFFRIVLCSGKLCVLSFYIFMLLKRLFMWMWKYQHAQNLWYICSTPLLLLKNMEVTSKTDTLTAIIHGMHPIALIITQIVHFKRNYKAFLGLSGVCALQELANDVPNFPVINV